MMNPYAISSSFLDPSKTAQQNATGILNGKYGAGNWAKGPKSEFNQIVKWISRGLKLLVIGWIEVMQED